MAQTATAVVQTAAETYELRELPLPTIGADSALLEIEACGICGTDVEVFEGGPNRTYPIVPGHEPLRGSYLVKKLGSGQFECTGPFYRGARMSLGPMALLEIGGVEVAVASKKAQAADQEMFRHLGVEPSERSIVAVKSSVHFRADFQPIAQEVVVAADRKSVV